MADQIDFEAEGLLDGLQEGEREVRLGLLRRLASDGVGVEELRAAVNEKRLTLMPLERYLAGKARFTSTEIAERSGIPIEILERQWRAIGMIVPDRDRPALSQEDLDAAHRSKELLDAGIGDEALAELSRTIAVAMSQFAAASRQVVAGTFTAEGGDEGEISERVFAGGSGLLPLVAPTLEYVYRLHLREQLRHAAFMTQAADEHGGLMVAIAFADLVGYTKLGEQLLPEELGRVTGRLEEVAREVCHGPVRLVKLIGDAVMIASPDSTAILEAVHELVDTVAVEDEEFPLIRAGVSWGRAFSRGGDFYGRPVNMADRITSVARPGSILVDEQIRAQLRDDERFTFSRAGRKHLKGIEGAATLYRSRLPVGGETAA